MFDPEAFAQSIVATVSTALDAKMAPVMERIARIEAREPQKGADGVGFTGAMLDGEGQLAITTSKGVIEKLGVVVGKDGKDGLDGRDAEPVDMDALRTEIGEMIADVVAEIPKAVDGKDGKDGEAGPQGEKGLDGKDGETGAVGPQGEKGLDGAIGPQGEKGLDGKRGKDGTQGAIGPQGEKGMDGLGFDDLKVEHDGERGFKFIMERDGKEKSFDFSVPAMIYQGVYKSGSEYVAGDTTTYGGSTWHCNTPTKDAPGTSDSWQLIVKKGTDGKSGKDGVDGKRGIQGPRGKDNNRLGASS